MTLEEAKEFFKGDRYAVEQTAIEIVAVGDGYSKCKLEVQGFHKNALGHVMGGVYFTIADYAFAVATNDKEHATVTTTSQISYLRALKGNTLYAECKTIKNGRTTCFCQIDLTDNDGNLIAVVNTCGNHLN